MPKDQFYPDMDHIAHFGFHFFFSAVLLQFYCFGSVFSSPEPKAPGELIV